MNDVNPDPSPWGEGAEHLLMGGREGFNLWNPSDFAMN